MKKSYDAYMPHAQRPGTKLITIGYLKKERELTKLMRRKANGHGPKPQPVLPLKASNYSLQNDQTARP